MPASAQLLDAVISSIDDLDLALKECDGLGYDTYDTRVGSLYLYLSRKRDTNRLAEAALKSLYALELLSPIYFRRLRGIQPTWDPMGNSYRAAAQLTLYQADGRGVRLDDARDILDRVQRCAVGSPPSRGFALGFRVVAER